MRRGEPAAGCWLLQAWRGEWKVWAARRHTASRGNPHPRGGTKLRPAKRAFGTPPRVLSSATALKNALMGHFMAWPLCERSPLDAQALHDSSSAFVARSMRSIIGSGPRVPGVAPRTEAIICRAAGVRVPGRIRGSCAVAVPSSTVSAWTPWQRTIGMQKVAFTTLPVPGRGTAVRSTAVLTVPAMIWATYPCIYVVPQVFNPAAFDS